MENEFFDELYSYLADEGMTDLGSEDFFNSYKDIEGEKFNELFTYLSNEGMTDLSREDFNAKYFGQQVVTEKKNPDGTPIVPGGPGSPDAPSNFTPVEEDTDSLSTEPTVDPSLDTGDVVANEEEVQKPFSLSLGDLDDDVSSDSDYIGFTDAGAELNDEGEIASAIERQFGYNGFTNFLGDMYRGWATGAAQGNAVDDFMELALSNSENVTNEEIADFLKAQERLESQPESFEMKQFRRVSEENGGGFMGMMIGLMDNFSIAPAVLVQSIRSMMNAHSAAAAGVGAVGGFAVGAGIGAGLGAIGGPVSPITSSIGALFTGGTGAVGGAIGGATTALEGALSFAEFFKEELEEQGLPLDQSGVRKILEDPQAMSRIRNRALARGLTIGTVEAVTMGLSKGVVTGIAKAGTKVSTKGLLKGSIKGKRAIQASRIAAGLTGTTVEAIGGSSGEALGRLVAGQEMDEIDIFLEGIAGTSTAPISVGMGLLKVPKYKLNGEYVSQATIDNLVKKVEEGGMTMEELASPKLGIEIINDPARKKIITDAKSYSKLGLELDPNITDLNDRKVAIDLEYAKRAIKNPDLETSKITIKQIDKYLKAISDKYNGTIDAQAKQELQNEGTENPTPEQIKEKADAIFEQITASMDVQKLTAGGRAVGARDESTEDATEQSQQETESQKEGGTETKKTKVSEQQAIDALAEDGVVDPTPEQVSKKVIDLQAEVDAIENLEQENKGESLTRNEAVETETESNDGAPIKVQIEKVLDNLQAYQGAKIVGKNAIAAFNKLRNIAKRGAVAMSKILPKTQIIIVEDPVTYRALVGKDTKGNYNVEKDTIYINAAKADLRTVGHEIGHAILIKGLKMGEANLTAATTRMFESLRKSKALDKIMLSYKDKNGKVIKQSMADYLNDFASNYSENLQNEEKLTEVMGALAANFTRLDIKEKGLIRKFLDKIMKGIGLGKYVNELTATDRKVVSFLNAMAGNIASGTPIEQSELSILEEIQAELDAQDATTKTKKPKAKKKKAKKKKAAAGDVKVKPKKKPKVKAPKKGDQKETKAEAQFEADLVESGTAAVGNPTEINSVDKKIQDRDSINFKENYDMSLVKPSDKVDIVNLINDIARKKQKVWFWVADQLGYGTYEGVQMDAGPSYALQPENRKDKKIWASGKSANSINKNIAAADYIMIMSGSPRVSKLFNKKVYDAYVNKMGEFNAFKKQVLGMKKVPGVIKNILNKNNSWASLRRSPARKQFLLGIENAERTPTTELHKLLAGKNAFVDIEAIRDGFYKENDFAMNDIMMVLKPTKAGQESNHSTYQNDVLGEVVGVPDKKINAFDIMPEALKAKYENVLTRTQQSQAVAPFGSGVRDIQAIQDRDQISMGRFIDDYKINEKGFMPSNIFNLPLLRKQAREFGFGVKEARFKEGYRRGEVSGYYLTRNGRFFNPRARYQVLDTNNPVDLVVDARKNNLSEAAIKIALDAQGLSKPEIMSALENADFYADISAEVPASFKLLGEKRGTALYNKIIDFVKEKNIDNAKPNKRKPAKELAAEAENKRADLVKKAKLKTNEEIEVLVEKEKTRLRKLKSKLTDAEVNQRANKKLFALQQENLDKLNRINNSMLKFQQNQIKKNDKLAPKLSKADIIDAAIELLQIDPDYIDAKGKKEGKSDLQMLLVDQLLTNLATRATTNVNQKIKAAQNRMNKKLGGKTKLGKKDVFYVQTQLINLVKQTIPAALFNTAQVKNLLTQIRDVAKPGRDIADVTREVTRQINTINNKFLSKQIESILEKSYSTKSGGVVRAKQIAGNISSRIKNILKNTLIEENSKLELSELQQEVTNKNSVLQDRLNELGIELKTNPEAREELLNEMADIQLAMEINNALVMDDNSSSKVGSLNSVLESLEEMVLGGESVLKLKLKQQQEAHMETINRMYEAITGEKLDLSLNENVKIANKAIADAKQIKDKKSRRIFVISRVYTALKNALKFLRTSTSGLALLMEKIDVLPGELFGGVMQELVYEKINESSYAFKQFQIDNKKLMIDKAVELFVTKKFLGVKKPSFVQRRQAINALRKMNETKGSKIRSDSKIGKLMRVAGVYSIYEKFAAMGRVNEQGNNIYTDPAAVEKAIQEYKDAKLGFDKLRKKAIMRDVIYANQWNENDAEVYYLYNQYKDESNHINFAMNPRFGKDHARIMQELTESMSPELKAYADWQVNELYPSLYERYNEVYKKIYHIDLPWNDQYGGRLYLEGVDNDAVSLIGRPNIYKTGDTKSASLFNRVHHNNPIQIMNGNNALSTYLTDMDWFAAYAENINSISKAFGNATIKGAITAKEGDYFYETIDKIINQVASRGISTSRSNKLITYANNFFISTRIALTPIIAAKQLLSTFTYVGNIGFVNWMKYAGLMTANTLSFGKFGQGFAGAAKEIFANSPYLKDRYSTGFQNTIEAYNNTKETKLLPGGFMQFVMNFNMFFSKAGDAGAIFMGGIPAYLYYKTEAQKANPNASEQQIIDIAMKQFQKATKETQQSSDLQDKDIYQMGDDALRYLNMFKTTPKQYLRKSMYSQIQMGRKTRAAFRAMFAGKNPVEIYNIVKNTGKGTFLENLRNYMLYYTAMPVSFQYMAMGLPGLLKPEFDDEDINDLVRAAALGNIGAVFIVGDLVKGLSDFYIGDKAYAEDIGQGFPVFELASQLNTKYSRWERLKPGPDKDEALLQFVGSAMDLGGLPGTKGMQGFTHLTKIQKGGLSQEELAMRYLGYSEYIIKQSKRNEDPEPPEGLSPKDLRKWKNKNLDMSEEKTPKQLRDEQKTRGGKNKIYNPYE